MKYVVHNITLSRRKLYIIRSYLINKVDTIATTNRIPVVPYPMQKAKKVLLTTTYAELGCTDTNTSIGYDTMRYEFIDMQNLKKIKNNNKKIADTDSSLIRQL